MTKKQRIAFIAALALVAAAFFYLNCITPFYADDYSYMFTYAENAPKERITNLYELYLSQLNHYKVMNGRAIVHTLVQIFLIPQSRALFNVCNTLVFMALGFAVYFAAYGTFRRFRPLSLFAVYALVWLTLPGFGQSCLWLTGSVNYMWTAFAALCFLLPYRSDSDGASRKWLRVIGMPFLGLPAGWSGENACIAAAVGLVLLLVRRAILRRPFRLWMLTGALGYLAGAAALLLAPAQQVRAEGMGGLGGLSTWISRIPSVTMHALEYLWLPLLLGVVLLIVSIVQTRGKGFMYWLRKYSAAICWLCAAVVSAYCMCAAPYFPLRAWCCAGVLAAATVLSVFAEMEKPQSVPRALPAVVTAAVCLACAATYCMGAADILATRADVRARDASILEQKSAGATDVYAESVSGSSRYNCFDPEGDLVDDPDSWQNGALALYYDVEHVILAPDGE